MSDSCANCRFWKHPSTSSVERYRKEGLTKFAGTCQRYPHQHRTYDTDWCGEHQPISLKPDAQGVNEEMIAALKLAEGHLEEMRQDLKQHPIGHCPVLDHVRAVIRKAEKSRELTPST